MITVRRFTPREVKQLVQQRENEWVGYNRKEPKKYKSADWLKIIFVFH